MLAAPAVEFADFLDPRAGSLEPHAVIMAGVTAEVADGNILCASASPWSSLGQATSAFALRWQIRILFRNFPRYPPLVFKAEQVTIDNDNRQRPSGQPVAFRAGPFRSGRSTATQARA